MNWHEQIRRLFSLFQYFWLAFPVKNVQAVGWVRSWISAEIKLTSLFDDAAYADDRYGVTKANRHAAGFPVGHRQKPWCQLRFKFTNRRSLFLPIFQENRPNDQLMLINYGPPIGPDENQLTFFTQRRFCCIFSPPIDRVHRRMIHHICIYHRMSVA